MEPMGQRIRSALLTGGADAKVVPRLGERASLESYRFFNNQEFLCQVGRTLENLLQKILGFQQRAILVDGNREPQPWRLVAFDPQIHDALVIL